VNVFEARKQPPWKLPMRSTNPEVELRLPVGTEVKIFALGLKREVLVKGAKYRPLPVKVISRCIVAPMLSPIARNAAHGCCQLLLDNVAGLLLVSGLGWPEERIAGSGSRCAFSRRPSPGAVVVLIHKLLHHPRDVIQLVRRLRMCRSMAIALVSQLDRWRGWLRPLHRRSPSYPVRRDGQYYAPVHPTRHVGLAVSVFGAGVFGIRFAPRVVTSIWFPAAPYLTGTPSRY